MKSFLRIKMIKTENERDAAARSQAWEKDPGWRDGKLGGKHRRRSRMSAKGEINAYFLHMLFVEGIKTCWSIMHRSN